MTDSAANTDERTPEKRLADLGLTLPVVATPLAAYVPAVIANGFVYTSGQLPFVNGELPATGKVGADVDVAQAAGLARICALNAIAAVVKVVGFVASAPDFTAQAQVINGASELLIEVFGEAGRHARSAVGMAVLPLNSPVEVEFVAELADS